MALENCQMLLKIMTISSSAAQILKKNKWREISLVFSGENILSGCLFLYFTIQKNITKNIIKSHMWIPRINKYWCTLLFASCLHSKLKNDKSEISWCFSQVHPLPSSLDATTMNIFVCILLINVFILLLHNI